MNWYLVGGDYGPIGGMYIEYWIYTSNRNNARRLFCERVQRDYPIEWRSMGEHNVSIVRTA